jgi:hypothetical protein
VKPKFSRTGAEFRRWLERHHASAPELLVGFYKTASGRASISVWSTVNTRRAPELAEQGRMAPAAQKAFAARRAHRSGQYSYEQRPAELIAPYDLRVGVERGEGPEVRRAPLPQPQPSGGELGHGSLSVQSAADSALARASQAGIIERIVMVQDSRSTGSGFIPPS